MFTPNGDGVNDLWFLSYQLDIGEAEIKIYKTGFLASRKVYSASFKKGGNFEWDGTENGGDFCSDGKYRYELTLDGSKTKGYVCLVRNSTKLKSRDCIKKCAAPEPLKSDPELN